MESYPQEVVVFGQAEGGVRRRLVTAVVGLVLLPTALVVGRSDAVAQLDQQTASAPPRGPAEVTGTAGQGLRVRAGADPVAEVDAVLPEGTPVEIVGGPLAAGGYTWYQVRYPAGQQTGWAAAAFLVPLGASTVPGGGPLHGPALVAGTGAAGLRVRRAPDLTADTRAVLPEGARIEVVEGPVLAGEYAWYRVRYDAGVAIGWVAGDYLALSPRPDARLAGALAADSPAARARASGPDPASRPMPPVAATPTPAARPVSTPSRVSPAQLDELLPAPPTPAAAPPPYIGIPPEIQSVAPAGAPPWLPYVIVPPLPRWQSIVPLPAVSSADPRFGLVEAFRLGDRELDRALGARVQRLVFPWPVLQPDGPEGLDTRAFPLDWLDQQRERGYRLVGLLLGTPSWAARDPSAGVRAVPRNIDRPWDDPTNYWARFAATVARTYAGRVDDWVIWRDPDLLPEEVDPARLAWLGSVDDYYALLRAAYRAIKHANPQAQVHLAGLTYWHDFRAGRPQYFERLLTRIAADPTAAEHAYYFDVATLHLYADPRALYHAPRLYRDLMRAQGFAKPIWVGEAAIRPAEGGSADGDGSDPGPCALGDQASFIVQAFALGLAGGADQVSIAKAQDTPHPEALLPREWAERAGLARADGTLRPAFVAYQTAVRYLQDAGSAQYFPGASAEAVVVARPHGQRTTVLWNAAPFPVVALLPQAGEHAEVVNAAGDTQPVTPTPRGDYALVLPPATCASDPADPLRYVLGGETYLLVEQGVPADRPMFAPRAEPWTPASPAS